MRNGKRPAAAAVALVALLGAACGGSDGDTGSGDGGGTVTLTASEFAWDPSTVTTAGDSIELVNEDEAKHNLTVEAADVDEDVEPGSRVTVDLAGVEACRYDFFCEYHPDMKGTLEVE